MGRGGAIAEEGGQDGFVTMHRAWRLLRDGDEALSYLKRTVVSHSRSRRHAHNDLPGRQPVRQAAEQATRPEPGPLAALRALPARQPQPLVLRYYARFPPPPLA